ncbi:MAG: hypothetical protein H7263_03050 [Candidatus Sericytochromatia bacterium]|nr:hypothetical protein [Candidatus Sericytochromatia bacterium]
MKKISFKFAISLLMTSLLVSCSDNTSTTLNNLDAQTASIQSAQTNKKREAKYNIKLKVKNRLEATDLISHGLDLSGSGNGGNFDAYATQKQIDYAKSKNINISNAKNAIATNAGLPTGYHTVSQVLDMVKGMATKNPSIASFIDIGDSWEKTTGKSPNNDIWALVLSGKNVNPKTKSTAVFISGMHSRELLPVEINLKLMDYLISNYGKDPQVTNYIDTREIVFIPIANIDGRIAVEKGESMWRKNRHIDSNYDGIDLNRNFDGHWNFEGVNPLTPELKDLQSQLSEKNSEIYSGPNAFSEPETQTLNNFFKDKNVTVMMDMHAYGNMLLYPPGYDTSAKSDPTTVKVAKYMAGKNGYKTGTSLEILYATCGTSKDWGFDKHKAISFTMEMGDDSDGFRPPFTKVEETWAKNKVGLTYLVSIADNPVQRVK